MQAFLSKIAKAKPEAEKGGAVGAACPLLELAVSVSTRNRLAGLSRKGGGEVGQDKLSKTEGI